MGSTVLTEQVLLSGCEAKGAVDDSIGQEGDYNRFTQMKRGNLFSGKWVDCGFFRNCMNDSLPRFACLLPIFRQQS